LHRIALAQTVPKAITDDEPERAALLTLANDFTPEEIQLFYQIAIHGRAEIELAPDEYAGFTMTLLRMLAFTPSRQSVPAVTIPRPLNIAVSVPSQVAVNSSSQIVVSSQLQATETLKVEDALRLNVPAATETDWNSLLTALKLQAMAQQLAKHCVLESVSDTQVVLRLAQEHKHLQTKMATDSLQAALCDYFARPVKLSIVLGNIAVATPAKIEHETRREKQVQAIDSIAKDVFVLEAQAQLDASLITDSIKPV